MHPFLLAVEFRIGQGDTVPCELKNHGIVAVPAVSESGEPINDNRELHLIDVVVQYLPAFFAAGPASMVGLEAQLFQGLYHLVRPGAFGFSGFAKPDQLLFRLEYLEIRKKRAQSRRDRKST